MPLPTYQTSCSVPACLPIILFVSLFTSFTPHIAVTMQLSQSFSRSFFFFSQASCLPYSNVILTQLWWFLLSSSSDTSFHSTILTFSTFHLPKSRPHRYHCHPHILHWHSIYLDNKTRLLFAPHHTASLLLSIFLQFCTCILHIQRLNKPYWRHPRPFHTSPMNPYLTFCTKHWVSHYLPPTQIPLIVQIKPWLLSLILHRDFFPWNP